MRRDAAFPVREHLAGPRRPRLLRHQLVAGSSIRFFGLRSGGKIGLTAALISTLLAACTDDGASGRQGYAESADVFMLALSENRTSEAAHSMFFPSAEGDSSSREAREVARGLAFVLRRFGKPTAYERLRRPVEVREFIVGTGQRPYWWRPGLSDQSVWFDVDFAHLGRGTIRLNLVEAASSVAAASVAFGLPASRPDACSIMLEFTKAALSELEPHHPFPDEIEIDGC